MILVDAWKPYPLVFTCDAASRSRENLLKAVAQFDVEHNPRYTPRAVDATGHQYTFCNIFLWDVTRALLAEIPHWVDGVTKAPTTVGAKGAVELSANGVAQWLDTKARAFSGWTEVLNPRVARAHAYAGGPACVAWWNHTGIGHVAVVMPSPDSDVGVTYIAQSGGTNFEYGPLTKGFGRIQPKYYIAP